MPNKNVTEREQERIASKVDAGWSIKDIATALDLNYPAVYRIVRIYCQTGKTQNGKRGGDRRSKLNDQMKQTILDWVDENCLLTLKELCLKIYERYNVQISKSTVDRCLKEFHYTVKSTAVVPVRRNVDSTLDGRALYAQRFRRLEELFQQKSLIFVDEVGFAVSTRPKKGRSIVGSSAYVHVPAVRTRNISVFAAMNRYGMLKNEVFNKPITGEDFKTCLMSLYQHCDSLGIRTPVFIMDNARIHHYRSLQDTIGQMGICIEYLPPYSPFLNPIENCFSKWKNFVTRGQARDEQELKNLIQSGFTEVTEDDCDGYYRKMSGYINRCLNNEIIFE